MKVSLSKDNTTTDQAISYVKSYLVNLAGKDKQTIKKDKSGILKGNPINLLLPL